MKILASTTLTAVEVLVSVGISRDVIVAVFCHFFDYPVHLLQQFPMQPACRVVCFQQKHWLQRGIVQNVREEVAPAIHMTATTYCYHYH